MIPIDENSDIIIGSIIYNPKLEVRYRVASYGYDCKFQ